MAKTLKTYKTRENEALIKLSYAGVPVSCHFINGNVKFGKWATLTTSNDIVQRAIESSRMFGRTILLESEVEIVEEKKVELEDITTLQQLRDYLVSEYKVDRTKISSPTALRARVKELGIELPNLTI